MTRLLAVFLSLCAFLLIGCSAGGSGGGSSALPQQISVSVTPSAATVDGGDSVTLTANVVNDAANAGVHWTLSGQGTLSNTTSASAIYTAPTQPPDNLSVSIVATSVSNSIESGHTAITVPVIPTLSVNDYNVLTHVGTPLSVQLQASGGIPPYTFSIASGSLPACITFSNGTFSTNGVVPGRSCIGSANLQMKITDSGTPTPVSNTQPLTVSILAAPPITIAGNVPLNATAGQPYTGSSITATGGAGALTYTISSGSLPGGLGLDASTAAITGTPTAAGTFNFSVTASDVYADTASQSYQIVVNATNVNAALKGTFACIANGMGVNNNPEPWAAVFSIVFDGQGNVTSGSEDLSENTSAYLETLTGAYALTTASAGTAAITETTTTGTPAGHKLRNWALVVPPYTSPITYFRMLDTDIPQPNYDGDYGAARCYLSDPSAFTAATLNHSFVFALRGEYAPGPLSATAEAAAGRFDTSSGAIANGYLEDIVGGDSSPELVTFTGSLGAIDPASGRVTATFTRSYHNTTTTQLLALYFIDATRALAVDISNWNGIGKVLSGELRLQKQNSWSVANVSGPFVFSTQGSDLTDTKGYFPITGVYSQILQGSAGGSGNLTLNRSFRNDSGTYTNSTTTTKVTLGFDTTNPGRATLLLGSTPISLYFFDNNSAFELSGSPNAVESGLYQPQTQTIFNNSAIAGTYIAGPVPPIAEQKDIAEALTLNASSNISGNLTSVNATSTSIDQPISMVSSEDTQTPAAGTFVLSGALATLPASCAVVSSTEFVCLSQTDTSPSILIGQN